MTTDEQEGRRQAETMKPPALKVGDKVRLKAGGQEMTVIATDDYGSKIVCEIVSRTHDTFPVSSLVRVASDIEAP